MIKCVNFPEKYNHIKSVEVNDIIYINNCYTMRETKDIFIPLTKVRLMLPTSLG